MYKLSLSGNYFSSDSVIDIIAKIWEGSDSTTKKGPTKPQKPSLSDAQERHEHTTTAIMAGQLSWTHRLGSNFLWRPDNTRKLSTEFYCYMLARKRVRWFSQNCSSNFKVSCMNSTLNTFFFFLFQRCELMPMWVLHELMASILFLLLLLLSLYSISCFKSESSPWGRLYFSSFVSTVSLSEREGGSNSHKGDGDRGVGCWQTAKAKKCCTAWPQS